MQTHEAVALFDALWPKQGWSEFRMLDPKGGADRPMFLPLPVERHIKLGLEWIERKNAAGMNAYFGVNPRVNPRGRNQDVPSYCAMIADLDNESSWPDVVRLSAAGAAPSACVRTSRGMHLYWLLKNSEPTNGETRARVARLQRAIKSDRVHDPARILRVPGTVCWKGKQPHNIYLAWLNPDQRYSTSEVDEAVRSAFPEYPVNDTHELDPRVGTLPSGVFNAPFAYRPLSHAQWERFNVVYPKGTRSEICLSFIQTTILHGWTDEQIANTLIQLPIGQHYVDRGTNGSSSLEYDLTNGRRHIASRRGRITNAVIAKASFVQEESRFSSAIQTKVKLSIDVQEDDGSVTRLSEWLTVPNTQEAACDYKVVNRWAMFTDAVKLTQFDFQTISYGSLKNRELLLEIKQLGSRSRVVWFGTR